MKAAGRGARAAKIEFKSCSHAGVSQLSRKAGDRPQHPPHQHHLALHSTGKMAFPILHMSSGGQCLNAPKYQQEWLSGSHPGSSCLLSPHNLPSAETRSKEFVKKGIGKNNMLNSYLPGWEFGTSCHQSSLKFQLNCYNEKEIFFYTGVIRCCHSGMRGCALRY